MSDDSEPTDDGHGEGDSVSTGEPRRSRREVLEGYGIWLHPDLTDRQVESFERLYREALMSDDPAKDEAEGTQVVTDPIRMAREHVGDEEWADKDGVQRLRVMGALGFGEVRDRVIVATPGGTLTADAETNALRDIIEEHEPEEHEGPIPLDQLGARIAAGRHVGQDLIPDGQLVTLVGEEGEGKSTLAWQIACEVSSGQPVGGHFEVPEPVAPVLIVDVEQTEEDAVILRNDMIERGLDVSGVFWLDANGWALDNVDDQKKLTSWIRTLRPQLIILDTGTEAVTKPREDESAKQLFILLHRYMKGDGVRAVLMLAQPRKRSQEAPTSRRFDDLFGSRVWKGRSSAVLYLEQERLTVWKQRGGYLKRRWGGSTVGRIVRSDTGPTKILGPLSEAEAEAERRTTILATIAVGAGSYSKTSLIEDELGVNGHDRPKWRKTVDALIAEGKIHTEGRYNKLYPAQAAPTPP